MKFLTKHVVQLRYRESCPINGCARAWLQVSQAWK
jgi:hypothetical protein